MFKILVFVAILATVFADSLNQFKVPSNNIELGYRLPNHTEPISYEITLATHIHLDDSISEALRFQFKGEVFIHFRVKEATKSITLHQRQLNIQRAELFFEGKIIKIWTSEHIVYDVKYEFLTFETETDLIVDQEYRLRITYFGTLRNDQYGFYRSSYVAEDGSRHWLATTQFQATDARHAFPCFDEPAMRAVFSVKILHGNDYFAISNTPVKSKETNYVPGYTLTEFENTPKMQTYLVAFVISDYTFVEVHGNVRQRVYASQEAIEAGHGDFAVRAGVKILKATDEYVNMNYGEFMPKLDQIAIPDFTLLAMENWGLVTYQVPLLLFNEKTDTWTNKAAIASLIGHEYIHQYFGNLVAIDWWSYLWLNEAFGNLYGYLLLRDTYPEFDGETAYQLSQQHIALYVDAFGFTRPMTHYVESPEDISGLFDYITYPKSGSVLRMWIHSIGESTWRKGLNFYVNEMKFKAATSRDFARGLQKGVEEDKVNLQGHTMEDIISNWSETPGYPVLDVSLTADNKLKFKQTQFQYSLTQPMSDAKWIIPVSIASASHPNFKDTKAKFWIKDIEQEVSVDPRENITWNLNDWIIVNLGQTGYYRVNYETKLWNRTIEKMNSNTFLDIESATRTGLINDAFNLARAEDLDYSTAFRLTEYLIHETHFAPWTAASNEFNYINRLLSDTAVHGWFNSYMIHLISPLYDQYGTRDLGNSEVLGDKRSRELAINWACRAGYSNCREETSKLVDFALNDNSKEIVPDLQQAIYCAGLREKNLNEWTKFWEKQQSEKSENFRLRLLAALGCNERSEVQNAYLESTLTNSKYHPNEYSVVIESIYHSSTSGLYSTINFLTENAKEAQNKYGGLRGHASEMASLISSADLLQKYTELLNKLKAENIISSDDEIAFLGISKFNLDWQEANSEEIESFLKEALKTSHATKLAVFSTSIMTFLAIIMSKINI